MLSVQTSVLFDATTPVSHQQLQLCRALHVQNTAIDSYSVAMEIHQQPNIWYVAVNSGASSNFYPCDYIREKHDPTAATIQVGYTNKEVMTSIATYIV